MPEHYIYLDHTADAKFQAFGASLAEAFSHAAYAMFGLMCDMAHVKAAKKKTVSVSGKDRESLLYNFLEELLFLFDSQHFLLSRIEAITISGKAGAYTLKAAIQGDASSSYEFFTLVKGITYNEMFIRSSGKGKKKFIIQVVVDL